MLLFDKKRALTQIMGGGSDGKKEGSDMDAIAQELIDAVNANDPAGVSEALHAAFAKFDSEPHEEGPHE